MYFPSNRVFFFLAYGILKGNKIIFHIDESLPVESSINPVTKASGSPTPEILNAQDKSCAHECDVPPQDVERLGKGG